MKGPLTILGAGIVGICCALEARRAGWDVTLIDRDAPGAGTSSGNAGVVSPFSVVPQSMPGVWRGVPGWLLHPRGPVKLSLRDLPATLPWARRFLAHATEAEATRISDAMAWLMRGNADIYAEWLRGTGDEDLISPTHLLMVARGAPRPDLSDLASRLRMRHGADLSVLSGAEAREVEPALSPAYAHAVLLRGGSRATDPGRLCRVLAARAAREGVRIRRLSVTALKRREHGIELRHADGTEEVARLILTAGAWSARLLAPLGIHVPLIGERGYHLSFPDPGVTLSHMVADTRAKVFASSMGPGLRVAGTAEFADPDAPPNPARARALAPAIGAMLPGLRQEGARPWMGVRPSTPDSLPVIGPLGPPGLYGAFGHGHYGLGMAPRTARLAIAQQDDAPVNEDVSAVAADRFA